MKEGGVMLYDFIIGMLASLTAAVIWDIIKLYIRK
jgi:hypothetical protein